MSGWKFSAFFFCFYNLLIPNVPDGPSSIRVPQNGLFLAEAPVKLGVPFSGATWAMYSIGYLLLYPRDFQIPGTERKHQKG